MFFVYLNTDRVCRSHPGSSSIWSRHTCRWWPSGTHVHTVGEESEMTPPSSVTCTPAPTPARKPNTRASSRKRVEPCPATGGPDQIHFYTGCLRIVDHRSLFHDSVWNASSTPSFQSWFVIHSWTFEGSISLTLSLHGRNDAGLWSCQVKVGPNGPLKSPAHKTRVNHEQISVILPWWRHLHRMNLVNT